MRTHWIASLYDYNAWANSRLFDLAERLEPVQFTQTVGLSFGSVRDTFAHLVSAETNWLRRWQGEAPRPVPPVGNITAADLRRRLVAADEALQAFVGDLTEAELEREITYTDGQGRRFTSPLWQMLLHVANHGTHHRSEISEMLTQFGTPPSPIDLIQYFRQ